MKSKENKLTHGPRKLPWCTPCHSFQSITMYLYLLFQANESRRVGSGRHRSNMHPQQQQQGGHGHQVSSSRHHQRSKYPVQAVPGQHPGQHPQYMQGMPHQQQPQQPRGPMVAPTTGKMALALI